MADVMASLCLSGRLFDVLIVGAGPAGIAATLALQGRRIAWVDPEFSSGRLARWHTVPCNTKIDLLVGQKFFAHPLLESMRMKIEPALDQLVAGAYPLPESKDPSTLGFCYLGDCKAVYDALTAELQARDVETMCGHVDRLAHGDIGWKATCKSAEGTKELMAHCVVLATGVEPKKFAGPCAMSVEDVFNTELLASKVRPGEKLAVLGNSHSAAIALANLHALKDSLNIHIVNFVRRPVRLAEWVPDLGTYRYTSTGLKGFGAVFGQKHMTHDSQSIQIRPAESFVQNEFDWIIDCTGYVPTPLPAISDVSCSLERSEASGRLGQELGISGLFAVGAPWPEPPGRYWGKGMEDAEGFRTESNFIGFHLFFDRAASIASEIDDFLTGKEN